MSFGSVVAVNNLSTTIKSGEMVSLLGPSGCGKSTTLMLLAGLYKPVAGQIFFGDDDVTKVEAENRGIGMVFQNYALYPHMTVRKNILFPLNIQKVNKTEAEDRMMEIARLVQIDHLLDRKPGQLSGGQQQRVAIARALVKRPKLLLLDEPLSNLDARLRLEMREEIRRIQLDVGITAVFVTHDQEEAMSISDRIILMKDGVLMQQDKPQRMYNCPSNIFTAEFIGNPPINILSTEKGEDGLHRITGMERPVEVLQNTKDLLANLPQVKLGIRPEHLFVTDKQNAIISGEVGHVETIGKDTLVKVKTNEADVRLFVDGDASVQLGDVCHLSAKPENIFCFDPQSGERLGDF